METILRHDRKTLSATLFGIRVELSRALYDLPGTAEHDARRAELDGYLDRVEEVGNILYDVRVDRVDESTLAGEEQQEVLDTLRRAARTAERRSQALMRASDKKVEKAAKALGVVEEGLEALLKLVV